MELIICQWCSYFYTQELDEDEFVIDGEHCPCCGSEEYEDRGAVI